MTELEFELDFRRARAERAEAELYGGDASQGAPLIRVRRAEIGLRSAFARAFLVTRADFIGTYFRSAPI